MIETVVYVGVSLDGFLARKDGSVDWLPDPPEGEDFGWAEFFGSIDAIVMGRATFEVVLEFGVWHYADTPVIVLSRTMTGIPEHLAGKAELSQLAPGPLLEQLAARGHRRVYVDGGRVVQSFLAEDRVDELILTTVPMLLGEGIPLFGALEASLTWELVSSETLAGGLVQSRYRRR
ncbi:MAG: dihydrofolate reductase family protein [Planctomycetota bacterium]|jgi:dihydrofolate reductase